jgi:hypothetical protein
MPAQSGCFAQVPIEFRDFSPQRADFCDEAFVDPRGVVTSSE